MASLGRPGGDLPTSSHTFPTEWEGANLNDCGHLDGKTGHLPKIPTGGSLIENMRGRGGGGSRAHMGIVYFGKSGKNGNIEEKT